MEVSNNKVEQNKQLEKSTFTMLKELGLAFLQLISKINKFLFIIISICAILKYQEYKLSLHFVPDIIIDYIPALKALRDFLDNLNTFLLVFPLIIVISSFYYKGKILTFFTFIIATGGSLFQLYIWLTNNADVDVIKYRCMTIYHENTYERKVDIFQHSFQNYINKSHTDGIIATDDLTLVNKFLLQHSLYVKDKLKLIESSSIPDLAKEIHNKIIKSINESHIVVNEFSSSDKYYLPSIIDMFSFKPFLAGLVAFGGYLVYKWWYSGVQQRNVEAHENNLEIARTQNNINTGISDAANQALNSQVETTEQTSVALHSVNQRTAVTFINHDRQIQHVTNELSNISNVSGHNANLLQQALVDITSIKKELNSVKVQLMNHTQEVNIKSLRPLFKGITEAGTKADHEISVLNLKVNDAISKLNWMADFLKQNDRKVITETSTNNSNSIISTEAQQDYIVVALRQEIADIKLLCENISSFENLKIGVIKVLEEVQVLNIKEFMQLLDKALSVTEKKAVLNVLQQLDDRFKEIQEATSKLKVDVLRAEDTLVIAQTTWMSKFEHLVSQNPNSHLIDETLKKNYDNIANMAKENKHKIQQLVEENESLKQQVALANSTIISLKSDMEEKIKAIWNELNHLLFKDLKGDVGNLKGNMAQAAAKLFGGEDALTDEIEEASVEVSSNTTPINDSKNQVENYNVIQPSESEKVEAPKYPAPNPSTISSTTIPGNTKSIAEERKDFIKNKPAGRYTLASYIFKS